MSAPGWAGLPAGRALVMGILNATPDSFSDGGRHLDPAAAIESARAMLAAGADLLDIGGESTRPNARPVSVDEECARVLPIIAALAPTGAILSIDTRNAATMRAALDAGARIVNDVSALRHDPASLPLIAERGCPVILMHMRGEPPTMACHAHYANLIEDIADELAARRDAALAAGIAREAIALDPGFGFAKEGAQNIALLRALPRLAALGHPLAIGVSRKRFIGALAQQPVADRRDPGSIAAALFALSQGATILRVHNVADTVQAVRVWEGISP